MFRYFKVVIRIKITGTETNTGIMLPQEGLAILQSVVDSRDSNALQVDPGFWNHCRQRPLSLLFLPAQK